TGTQSARSLPSGGLERVPSGRCAAIAQAGRPDGRGWTADRGGGALRAGARDDPAQRDGESRLPRPPVAGVREDHGVGAQLAPVMVEELDMVWRAPLLLDFDEHGHTHRWKRVVRAQRAGMNDYTAVVVERYADIEVPVLLDVH